MARTTTGPGNLPTGRTPTYKFPWPDSADVHDIAYDIQVLAEAIHTALIALIPRGSIIAFPATGIPTGWTVCDGTAGTPDLRDKFVRAAGPANAHAAAGGSNTHTLTAAEMPPHTHTTHYTGASGGHGHGAATCPGGNTDGGNAAPHTHGAVSGMMWYCIPPGAGARNWNTPNTPPSGTRMPDWTGWNQFTGGAPHGHGVDIPAFGSGGPSGGHGHSGALGANAPSGSPFDITPLYYAVVFAMKT